jgi:RNA polymerase sigma factor (sigma-70 family)
MSEEQTQCNELDGIAQNLARKYFMLYRNKFEFEDLLQAARHGILDAVRTYDSAQNATLATHAFNRARQKIQGIIKTGSEIIHIPYKVRCDESASKPVVYNAQDRMEEHVIDDNSIAVSESRVVIEQLLIETLTPRQCAVIKLLYFDQLTMDEAAAELQITKQTVSSTAGRAIAKLQTATQERGIELGDLLTS